MFGRLSANNLTLGFFSVRKKLNYVSCGVKTGPFGAWVDCPCQFIGGQAELFDEVTSMESGVFRVRTDLCYASSFFTHISKAIGVTGVRGT